MAVKPSQTNVNKCATVVTNPLPKGTTGGTFICGVGTGAGPRTALINQVVSGIVAATPGRPGGVFATPATPKPRIDSVKPKGYK